MQGRMDGAPVLLWRVRSDAKGMHTESFHPQDDSWRDDPGDFMWAPESRMVDQAEAEQAMGYMRSRIFVREAAAKPEKASEPDGSADGSPDARTGSQIVARGELLDIPWETPEPSTSGIKYADPTGDEQLLDDQEWERRLAWANHYNFGTPLPDDYEGEPAEDGNGN